MAIYKVSETSSQSKPRNNVDDTLNVIKEPAFMNHFLKVGAVNINIVFTYESCVVALT